MTLDYSHLDAPPLHVRCRCDILPVLADEFSKTLNKALKPKDDGLDKLKQELEEQKKYAEELEKLLEID